jgi:TetR/AcrR family transcriptional regulator, tetracycline repressor protein
VRAVSYTYSHEVPKRVEPGARERLNRAVIVARAIELTDREGLAAVTFRRLADDYGVTPMAVYWHVKNKDELLDAIAEQLFASVQLPEVSREPWHRQLHALLNSGLQALRPHPGVVHLALTRILNSEAGLAIAERVLGLLRGARFSPEQAAQVGGYLISAIITLVTAEPGPGHALTEDEYDTAVRSRRAMLYTLSPKQYPNIVDSAEALAVCANADSYYEQGLELLVEGTRGIQPKRGDSTRP